MFKMIMFVSNVWILTLFAVSSASIFFKNEDLGSLKRLSLQNIEDNTNSFVDKIKEKWSDNFNPTKLKFGRFRRDAGLADPSSIVSYLNGTRNNNEAYVHWSGKDKSDSIFVLTRQSGRAGSITDSKVWRSIDYGATYTLEKFPTGTVIEYFYVSPANYKKAIFKDYHKKTLFITEDELNTKISVKVDFQPDHILPHPTKENWVLAYSFIARELRFSKNFGKTWTLLHTGVSPKFYWGIAGVDKDELVVHLEQISSDGISSHYIKCTGLETAADCKRDFKIGTFSHISLLVIKEYMFIEKVHRDHSDMYVSHNRGDFKKAYFPPGLSPKYFVIVNADEGQVFVGVTHEEGATLYLSDTTGQFYVPTLHNVLFKLQGAYLNIDVHEVKSLKGTYIANKKIDDVVKTYISYDKGGIWSIIPTPKEDLTQCPADQGCSLHLHLEIGNYRAPGILSEKRAPGLILTHGNIGTKLTITKPSVYASRDGGITWKNTGIKGGYYRFNILDQGSILTAIEEASTGLTRVIFYSYDEGNSWKMYEFLPLSKMIQVDGALNEPNINSLALSVYGHSTRPEGWTLITLNFSTVLTKPCKKEDYMVWLPGDGLQKNCTLGQTLKFERRLQSSLCYNGVDYENPINHFTPCVCKMEDYECDFGYELKQTNGVDKCVTSSWFSPELLLAECTEGQPYQESVGYRKVASDKCTGGISTQDIYKPTNKTCPLAAPQGLQLTAESNIVETKTEVVFDLSQAGGSKISTNYTWDFADNETKSMIGLSEASQVKHTFKQYGKYNVTVTASNTKGTFKHYFFLRVEDKVSILWLDTPWAVQKGRTALFDVFVAKDCLAGCVKANHSLFIWTWGDEDGSKPDLSWLNTMNHVYSESGVYQGSVETINSVSSVYKSFTVHVYDVVSTVRLLFSENIEKYDLVNNLQLRVFFFTLLKREIMNAVGTNDGRFDLQMIKLATFTVDVTFVPGHKAEETKETLAVALTHVINNQSIYVALDGEPDSSHYITVTSANIVDDTNVPVAEKETKPNYRAVYITIPVLVAIIVITLLVFIYYKRRYREARRYTMLRSRHDEDNQLLGDDDDDDDAPLDLNPDFGSDRNYHDDQLDLGSGSHLVMVSGGRISDDD